MNSSTLKAISLNNSGVELLERGSVYEAYETLTQACVYYTQAAVECRSSWTPRSSSNNPLATALEMAMRMNSKSTNNTTNQCKEGKRSCCSSLAFDYEWVDLKSALFGKEQPVGKHSGIVYPKANETSLPFLCLSAVKIQYDEMMMHLLIDQDMDMDIDDDDEYDELVALHAHRISSTMIHWPIRYNLAIVNHFMGIQMGECGRVFLEQAHHSYTIAQLSVPETSVSHVFRLLLSTQNNQMSIYQEFGMPEDLKACLKILTELMLTLPQYAERIDLDHEILLNLMVLSRTETAAAA